ncbi:uncharacterized protein [Anoplolepis gracilipes]|uniref:uncharacterized protein isoform X4 n=1 Tax=Anoplolepis gracilipes TaxID=354296 RepID=UPI003BA37A4D
MRAIVIKCFRACCAREEVTKDQQERRRRPREASGDGGAIMRVTVCALHSAAAHRTIRSKSQITKTSKYSLAANAENSQRRYIARRRLAKGLNGKQRQKAAEGETEIMRRAMTSLINLGSIKTGSSENSTKFHKGLSRHQLIAPTANHVQHVCFTT